MQNHLLSRPGFANIMNNNLLTYYNTIFNAQITSFSIILPILFVFIQLTNKEHSSFNANKFIKDIRLLIYFFIALLIIFISGLSSYLLTIKEYNFITCINFNSYNLISSNSFSLFIFILFFINFLPIVLFIIFAIKQINPGNFIENYLKNLDFNKLIIYLYKNYGLPSIDFSYLSKSIIISTHGIEEDTELNKKELAKLKLIHKKDKERNEKIEIQISENYENVFAVITNILNYNLSNIYITDFNRALDSLISSYDGLFKKLHNSKDKLLSKKLLLEYCSIINSLYSSAVNVNYRPFLTELIHSLEKLISYHIKNEQFDFCSDIFNTFEHLVDSSSKENFNEINNILNVFLCFSEDFFKKDTDNDTNENIIRTFSRVSEKVIIKYDINKQPIMISRNNEYVFSNIFEALYKYFKYYSVYRIDTYPLILLDCNYCVFKGLLEKINNNQSDLLNNYLNDHLYSFFYEPRNLCINLIEAHNIPSACLSIMRICELYELLIDLKQSERIENYIDTIIYLGFYVASQDSDLSCDFMNAGAMKYIFRKLKEYKGFIKSIDNIIFEIYIKSHSNKINIKKSETFLFNLGELFQSNFNLNFNWSEKNWNSAI